VIGPVEGTVFPETAIDTTGSVEFVGILDRGLRFIWNSQGDCGNGQSGVHFEIIGEDQQLLNDFYGSVFDWKIDQVMEDYAAVTPAPESPAALAPWLRREGMSSFMLRLQTFTRPWR
jgi:hypothetical protein